VLGRSKWKASPKWEPALERTLDLFGRLSRRAASIELRRSNVEGKLDNEDAEDWIRRHTADFASKVAQTTRTEVRDFIERQIAEGVTDRDELAKLARAHFSDFADWKADRLVRTEVRDVYNAATLMAARSAGINRVQALDARGGDDTDADCVDRNGQIFTLEAAYKEDEHPNGTLALTDVLIASPGVAEAASRFERFTGRKARANAFGEATLALDRGKIHLMSEQSFAGLLPEISIPGLPLIGAYALRVQSRAAVEALLKQERMPMRRLGAALVVPCPEALGVGAWLFAENAGDLPWRS